MDKFALYTSDGRKIQSDKTLVMGILNATPDSFSDGGELDSSAAVETRIRDMVLAGADILDVGGESTRPGHEPIGAEAEINRVLPIIRAVRNISPAIPISIDTQKAAVARAALEAGTDIINDVSGLGDKDMAAVAAGYGCSIILMRGKPTGDDPVSGCKKQFQDIVKKARDQGIDKSRLVLDPGLGFGDFKKGDYKVPPGSDPEANIRLILGIKRYSLGFPVVIGASRKRFIGDLAGTADPKDRVSGSVAAAIMAMQAGAAIVRVHDVAQTVQAFEKLQI